MAELTTLAIVVFDGESGKATAFLKSDGAGVEATLSGSFTEAGFACFGDVGALRGTPTGKTGPTDSRIRGSFTDSRGVSTPFNAFLSQDGRSYVLRPFTGGAANPVAPF